MKKKRTELKAYISRISTEKSIISDMITILEKNSIPPYFYSVGGYADESICLEKSNSKWIVYMGERGNRFDVSSYDSLPIACERILDYVSDSKQQSNDMIHEFQQRISRRTVPDIIKKTPEGKRVFISKVAVIDNKKTISQVAAHKKASNVLVAHKELNPQNKTLSSSSIEMKHNTKKG